MFKKLSVALLAIWICFFSASYSVAEEGLLWRVSKQGQVAGYLFGTMHSEDERIIAVLDHIEPKVAETQCLALELDLSPAVAAKVSKAMFFAPGNNLKRHVAPELYETVADIMLSVYGFARMQTNTMKPWALMMTLSIPKPETGMFLDRLLYLSAIKNNYRIHGLETPEEQIAVFDDMAMEDQVALLRTTVDSYEQMPEMFEQMVETYLSQDLSHMEKLYDEYTKGNDAALIEKLTERLLNIRNDLMTTRMHSLFQEQPCFVAVGALHLPGEQGLIRKLKQQNYDIQPVKLDLKK